MPSEQRLDWFSMIARPATSRTEDKRRRFSSFWVLLELFIFVVFLAGSVSLWNSGREILGVLLFILGLAVLSTVWIYATRSIERQTGAFGGWSLDTRSLLVGLGILTIGLFMIFDPLGVLPDNVYQKGNLLGILGIPIAVWGLVICVLSLRD